MMTLEQALELMLEVHSGQVDKQGIPYVSHTMTVGLMGGNREEMIVGLLHDAVEELMNKSHEDMADFLAKLDILTKDGKDELVGEATVQIARKKDEVYQDYIDRICAEDGELGRLLRRVKLNDIEDNWGRIPQAEWIPAGQKSEWKGLNTRYRKAYRQIYMEMMKREETNLTGLLD